jgi:energy-coupling factor transport system ATP-binding protein
MIRFSNVRCRCLTVPDLSLPEGHTVVIGPNGSGKTTFLALCAGFLLPESGEVAIDGMTPRKCEVGYMGEFPERTTLFARVRDEIGSPLRFSRMPPEVASARTGTVLHAIGIDHLAGRMVYTLSGGEIALVALATALVTAPPVLVLDEFDSHLDWESARQVTDVIRSTRVRHLVQCTQNMDLAAGADCVLYLEEGRVCTLGTPLEVFSTLSDTCFYPPSWRCSP